MTIRVGIISANRGAFAHLPAWRSIDGVEQVAICTSREPLINLGCFCASSQSSADKAIFAVNGRRP